MLTISENILKKEAKERGYRPEILEKVYRLLNLLEVIMGVPYLKERLVLKGGTALNLFCSDTDLPRLSVDLDFNYVGSTNREIMLQEKPILEGILSDIFQRNRYSLHRNPRAHAGGKMVFVYESIMGNKGRLEIDINYILRIPLWAPIWTPSLAWLKSVNTFVLDIHGLAAGKLHALLGREVSRDLFDSHRLLKNPNINLEKLKLAFTVYAGMDPENWQKISAENIRFTVKDIRDKLFPVLKSSEAPHTSSKEIGKWANQLVEECKVALSALMPFQESEIEFLERLHKHGEIRPELISDNKEFCQSVMQHPSLLWRIKQRVS